MDKSKMTMKQYISVVFIECIVPLVVMALGIWTKSINMCLYAGVAIIYISVTERRNYDKQRHRKYDNNGC